MLDNLENLLLKDEFNWKRFNQNETIEYSKVPLALVMRLKCVTKMQDNQQNPCFWMCTAQIPK